MATGVEELSKHSSVDFQVHAVVSQAQWCVETDIDCKKTTTPKYHARKSRQTAQNDNCTLYTSAISNISRCSTENTFDVLLCLQLYRFTTIQSTFLLFAIGHSQDFNNQQSYTQFKKESAQQTKQRLHNKEGFLPNHTANHPGQQPTAVYHRWTVWATKQHWVHQLSISSEELGESQVN